MARGRPPRTLDSILEDPVTLIKRGRWYAADFRSFGKGRPTLRDPDAHGWPKSGDRTEDPEVARLWADRYIAEFRSEKRRGQLKLGRAPQLLADVVEDFLRERRRVIATNTWDNDRAAMNHLLIFAGEDKATGRRGNRLLTNQLTADFVQRMFNVLIDEGYAPNTLRSIRRALSVFFQHLGWTKNAHPAAEVKLPDPVGEEVPTWTDDQLQRLRAAADELDRTHPLFRRFRRSVELGLNTGMRRNEQFAASWGKINSRTLTVRLTHQVHKDVPKLVPLKGKRARTALVLPGWWEHHVQGESGLLLPDRKGRLVHPERYWGLREELLDAAGLNRPGVGYHIDRHTYARDFIMLGGRFEELQKSLGHESISTTERAYGHFHEDDAAASARRRIYGDE